LKQIFYAKNRVSKVGEREAIQAFCVLAFVNIISRNAKLFWWGCLYFSAVNFMGLSY
jgi:hypothetical protein